MPTATFVDIPANAITDVLSAAGFEDITATLPRGKYGQVQELVFARTHHARPNVQIRVYTSIDRRTGKVRGEGEDRIMVCAFYAPGTGDQGRKASQRFLFSATGVNRCSSLEDPREAVPAILERLVERMRDTYRKAGTAPRCPVCGEPLKRAKSRKRRLAAWRGKPARPNPNFGRSYEACMSESCKHFSWLNTAVGKADPEPPKVTPKVEALPEPPKADPEPPKAEALPEPPESLDVHGARAQFAGPA